MVTGLFMGLVRGLRVFALGALFALPLATACGGSSCEDHGRTYEDGDHWTCSDGCNGCWCDGGTPGSTAALCDKPAGPAAGKLSCHTSSGWEKHGSIWACGDGCCTCDDGKTEAADPGSC